jgi:hypothetical protein
MLGGSLMELDTQPQIATNLGYLDHEAGTDLANQLQTVFAPPNGPHHHNQETHRATPPLATNH